jgi:hypothetical protein
LFFRKGKPSIDGKDGKKEATGVERMIVFKLNDGTWKRLMKDFNITKD